MSLNKKDIIHYAEAGILSEYINRNNLTIEDIVLQLDIEYNQQIEELNIDIEYLLREDEEWI